MIWCYDAICWNMVLLPTFSLMDTCIKNGILVLLLFNGLKSVFRQWKVVPKTVIKWNHLEQDCRCVSYIAYLAQGSSKSETRERSRHKNNSKILRNQEERNVGTIWAIVSKDLTSANVLTLLLSWDTPIWEALDLEHFRYLSLVWDIFLLIRVPPNFLPLYYYWTGVCFILLFHRSFSHAHQVSCVGYTPRAWDPRSL